MQQEMHAVRKMYCFSNCRKFTFNRRELA